MTLVEYEFERTARLAREKAGDQSWYPAMMLQIGHNFEKMSTLVHNVMYEGRSAIAPEKLGNF